MTYFPTEPSEIEEIFYNILYSSKNPDILEREMDLWIDATKAQLASYGDIYGYIAEDTNSTRDALYNVRLAESHYPADYFVAILRKAYALKEGLYTAPGEVEMEIESLRLKVLAAASIISFPLADRGQKFTGRKRGPLKISTVLKDALKEILDQLGEDAEINEVWLYIKRITREADHPVFYEVRGDKVELRVPGRDRMVTRTRKTIENHLSEVRKAIKKQAR